MAAPGFAVSISATDNASKTIDGINKRIAAMNAPAERFNKSVAKLADVSGVNKLAQGMQALGSRSLDVFRSLDRVAPALAGITSVASVAGMAALVARWSDLGNAIRNTSSRLGVPTDRLTALQGAARLAGSNAEDLTAGLGSLDEKLRSATFRGDGNAIMTFKTLGVNFGQIGVKARSAGDAFGDVADGIKKLYNSGETGRGAAVRAAQNLGLESLLPLLIKGREGVQALSADAARLGAVISPAAAERAAALKTSFTELSLAVEGVENRLGDKWGTAVKPFVDGTTSWISKNQELADSFSTIGAGILALGAIKPAAWLARLLGITSVLSRAGPLLPLMLGGDTNPNATPGGFLPGWTPNLGPTGVPYTGPTETFPEMLGREWSTWMPRWLGGRPAAQAPANITPPQSPGAARDVMERSRAFWLGKGYSPAQVAGILASESGESAFNPRVWDSGQYGLFQYTGERLLAMQRRYHTDQPSEEQQLEYAYEELQGPEAETNRRLLAARNAADAGRAFTGFERPGGWHSPTDQGPHAEERALAAPRFEAPPPGQVSVDINLRGAPPGTTARVQTQGPVAANPPNVVTAMPGH